MKKILILDTGKEWGGGTNSLIELLKRADRGRYSFAAVFYDNYKRGASSDVKTVLEDLGVGFSLMPRSRVGLAARALKGAGRPILSLTPVLKKKFIFSIEYSARILPASRRIAETLKGGGYDLLYMNNQPSSNLEGILAAESAGVASIQHSRVAVDLNSVEAKAVNRAVKRVICVSRGVADGLVASGVDPSLCTVVYNGIDPGVTPRVDKAEVRRLLGIKEGTRVIGTAGSLIKRKRVELLIEALSQIKGRDVTAVIVGTGPEEEALKALAKKRGVADRVVFTGFSSDAISYINAMDVFVLPSGKEGLPRVILEAMLMGRPVVAFDVVGPSELVEDKKTGFLLKDSGPGQIAAAVDALLNDASMMERMGRMGRQRVVESFSIDKYIKGVHSVFEEVLR